MMDWVSGWVDLLRRRVWVGAAILAGLAAAATLVFGVYPRIAGLLGRYQAWQQERDRVREARTWKQDLRRLRAEESRLRTKLDSLLVSVSRTDQISSVLKMLNRKAGRAGVTIQEVRPLDRRVRASHIDLPIRVRCEGHFHEVASFTDRLERSEYLIIVDRLRMEAQTLLGAQLNAEMSLRVITLRPLGQSL